MIIYMIYNIIYIPSWNFLQAFFLNSPKNRSKYFHCFLLIGIGLKLYLVGDCNIFRQNIIAENIKLNLLFYKEYDILSIWS